MAGIRAGLAALVACAVFVVPAAAWGASPGDKVAFEIPDTDRGDAYTISVDGEKAAEGVDDTEKRGISGEFTVPDLGDKAREVTVLIEVTKASDGSKSSYESQMDYTPATASESGPPTRPAQPAPPHPAGSTPSSHPPRPAPQQPVILPPPRSPSMPSTPQPAEPVEPSDSGGQTDGNGRSGTPGTSPSPGPLRPVGTPAERRRAKRHARKARRKANRFRPGRDPVPPKVRSVSPPRDTRADLSDERFPGFGYSVAWKLLLAVAAAGLLLPILVGVRTHLRRRREAAMEAELQEIVAEGRVDLVTRRG